MNENLEVPTDVVVFELVKDWIYRNRLVLILGFSAICLLTVVLFNMRNRSDEITLLAEREYLHFSSSKDWASLEKLIAIVEKYPTLKREYDAKIARALLEAGKEDTAAPYMSRTLNVLQEVAPHYASFAKVSVLISQNVWNGALQEAVKLKQEILQSSSHQKEATLYSFNQLRIALLCKKLGDEKGELQAWEDLEQHLGLGNAQEDFSSKSFLSVFQENGLTLKEYIASRKEALVN